MPYQCLLHVEGGGDPILKAGWFSVGASQGLDAPPRCGCMLRCASGNALSFSRCCPLLEKKTTPFGQRMLVGLQRGRAHLRWPGFPTLSPVKPGDIMQPSSAIPPVPLGLPRARARGWGQKSPLVKLFITPSFKC